MNKEALDNIELEEGEDFASLLEEYEKKEEVDGDEKLIEGVVVQVNDESVLVDVGMKIEGRIHPDEIKDASGNFLFKEGDKINVLITGATTEKPKISYKKAIKKAQAKEFILKNKDIEEPIDVTGTIIRKNAGGFIVEAEGIDMFLPISLAAYKPGSQVVGKPVTARIVKMDDDNGSVVLSRRAYLNTFRKKRREAIKKLVADETVAEGIVKSIKSYGMFVEVEGVEGLVHYTEISYKGPVNPATLFQVGDKVEVKAIDYDKDKKRLSLSIKAVHPNPWEEIGDELEVGDTVKVYVTNMEKYGAFVDLGNEIEGFLHISEISWDKNIKHPSEILKVEEEIDVEVIELEPKDQRLRVSLKRLQPKPFEKFASSHKAGDIVKGVVTSIKDFGCFLKVEGVEGLLHNEEVSWDKDTNAKDAFKSGDEVEALIIKLEPNRERISFSVKRLSESPIDSFATSHKINDVVNGEVIDIKEFGLFLKLADNVDGLVRIEDLGNKKIEDIQVGDSLEAVIMAIDSSRNKIRLSIKKLAKKQEREILAQINQDEDQGNNAFEDAFNALKK